MCGREIKAQINPPPIIEWEKQWHFEGLHLQYQSASVGKLIHELIDEVEVGEYLFKKKEVEPDDENEARKHTQRESERFQRVPHTLVTTTWRR